MELLVALLLLYLFLALVVFPIWALVSIRDLKRSHEALRHRAGELGAQVADLRSRLAAGPRSSPTPAEPAPVIAAPVAAPVPPPPGPAIRPPSTPPLLVPVPAVPVARPAQAATPPPPPAARSGWADSINWELFMGAKLFAWLGGLALFLGVAFFVKYSFDHGWIPAEARAALGFVFGAGLIVGGLRLNRDRYGITAQTLIATGVVSLYAVTFACRALYHFPAFGAGPTFALMALITAAAFVLAVRLPAQVVAVLGLLGGFLTPVLLSTGVDNPGGLFGYIALLDLGLIAVALRTGWRHLVPLSAGGTALMMAGWSGKFFTAEKGPVAMTVCVGFALLYLVAAEIARRREVEPRGAFTWTAVAMPFVGFLFAFGFLGYSSLAARAPLYLGFVLLLDGLLLRLAWTEEKFTPLHAVSGFAAFTLLACWTGGSLTDANLPVALAGYLGFAALHTVFPLLLQRARPGLATSWWSQLFPPLTLLLLMLPLFRLDEVSLLIWPAILLVDAIAIGLALLSASLAAVGAVLVLTLIVTGLGIFRTSAAMPVDGALLLVIGGFALFFFGASLWLVRRLGDRLARTPGGAIIGDQRTQLPAFSTLLPFCLLVMVCLRLPVPDPSMVFGLGLLLAVLALGLVRILAVEWLPLCALAGVAAMEYAWHGTHFSAQAPVPPLAWYLGFFALFAAYPFAFRRRFQDGTGPWAVAALAGVVQFPLVYRAVSLGYPNDVMGLLPALFALPPLVSLAAILRFVPADEPKRLNQLAWFGGAGLFFITLIFPVQFDRQWLTVGWALEGAALLWLFRRVPHTGLRGVGLALLVTAFGRLACNPAILSYHLRGTTPVFNWYLYAYGTVIAALFTGARLILPADHRMLGVRLRATLQALGTILLFLLLNLEVADFFTPAGAATLVFKFSGNLGRDMTYTIAWALFALGLLAAGIWRRQPATRYAGIALLAVALLKLFFHDLIQLNALYRIGVLFAVAPIAILASYAYQRFLPAHEKTPPPAA